MSPPIPPARLTLCFVLMCGFVTIGHASTNRAPAGDEYDNPQPPPSVHVDSSPGAPILSTSGTASTESAYLNTQWGGQGNNDLTNPPDPQGAVGPLGVLNITNRWVTYLRKNSLGVWGTQNLADLFTTYQAPGVLIDPRATYDPVLQRFYVTVLQTYYTGNSSDLTSYLHLAVSKSSNPQTLTASDWYVYRMDVTESYSSDHLGMDYPGLGYDSQAIYVTANMFRLPIDGSTAFRNCQIVAIDKQQAATGTLSWGSVFTPNTDLSDYGRAFTLQPVTVLSTSTPGDIAYFAEIPFYGPNTEMRLWALSQPLGARVLQDATIAIPDRGVAVDGASQCSTNQGVRTWSPTAQGSAFWYDGSLWFCHTGSASGHAVVRWYRVQTNGFPGGVPSLAESGGFDGGPGVWTYMPAIGGNALGDVGIVYTQSSANMCPTIMTSLRKAAGAGFSAPAALFTSPAPKLLYKFGDYATVAADPVDDGLWMCHEWATGIGAPLDFWGIYWGHYRFPSNTSGWPANGRVARSGQTPVRQVRVVNDVAGGMFVAWEEERVSGDWGLYVIRLASDGSVAPGWPEPGLSIYNLGTADYGPPMDLMSDGTGGVYMSWQGFGAYVQHLTGSGSVAPGWPSAGMNIGDGSYLNGTPPHLVSDGSGGVIICWEMDGVHAQRVLGGGSVSWPSGGVLLSDAGYTPDVAADGFGGAVIAWAPPQAQRISSTGVLQWGSGGVVLATDGEQPKIAADGSGGVYVTYQVTGSDQHTDLQAQHLDASGAVAAGWPGGGLALCAAPGAQDEQVVIRDGSGGMFAAWTDRRAPAASTRADIYVLRVTSTGSVPPGWMPGGSPICNSVGDQVSPSMIPDGADGVGGVVVAWQDRRTNPTCSTGACGDDVYYSRMTAAGLITIPGGAAVSTAAGNQTHPVVTAISPGVFGVAWEDGRLYANCVPWCLSAAYAQRVPFDFTSSVPEPNMEVRALDLEQPQPNPARDHVSFHFAIPGTAAGDKLQLAVYDIAGRRIRLLESSFAKPGLHEGGWDLRSDQGVAARSGMYFLRLQVGKARLSRSVAVR